MIKLEPVLDIVESTVWTGVIDGEKPLSVMLIASVGSGKSEILRKTYKPPKITEVWKDKTDRDGNKRKEKEVNVHHIGSVLYTTDTTPYTLYHRYGDLLKSGQIKHIVIPDFLTILTKSIDVMPATVGFYNSLIEEGICRIESKHSDFITDIPVRIGLITAVSHQDYTERSRKQNWGAMGFLSRVLPVSFRYSDNTKNEILTSIFLRQYRDEKDFDLKLPSSPIAVEMPTQFLDSVKAFSFVLRDQSDEVGARRLKQIMSLMMGNALKNGRDIVTQEDVDKILGYEKFFSNECRAIL
jgi:hypothetical protein